MPVPSDAEGPLSIAKGLTNALIMAAQSLSGPLNEQQAEWAFMQLGFAIRDQLDAIAERLDIDIPK